MKSVQILLFNEIEVLDFAGPFEVFSMCNDMGRGIHFDVKTVAETRGIISTRGAMKVEPHIEFQDAPQPDILIVPGGFGSRAASKNTILVDWVKRQSAGAEIVMSICTGVFVLVATGLIDGLDITTHHENLDELKQLATKSTVVENVAFVDHGNLITTAGVAAGIAGSLHIVQRLKGKEFAVQVAKSMEYNWTPD